MLTTQSEIVEGYDQLERQVRERIAKHNGPLFTTDADNLWELYLRGIPEDRRQHYTCNCCRRFIEKYGGLTTAEGPLLWVDAPPFFQASALAMYAAVATAKITGVFLSSDATWGTPRTGDWTHLSGQQPKPFANKLLNADQAMAEKRQDYIMLCNALVDYNRDAVTQALRILRADAVLRSEKALGVAEWFGGLHAAIAGKAGKQRAAILWQTVATAPPGFCHIRSTIISTLLDDVKAGMDFATIARRWTEKVHPLRYQRPVAPPTTGAIEVAEKLVEKLGIAPSFERRFATMADVLAKLWEPTVETSKPNGVFSHLKPKQAAATLDIPGGTISWEKFLRDVLPTAKSLAIEVPYGRAPFYGLVTAVHADAPPIIQWDVGEPRNPVSWYVYSGGSSATQWNLSPGSFVKVSAVFLPPHQWQHPGKFTNHAKEVFFALENCWDTKSSDKGLALFPEVLKSELHGIRSVIEAHSAKSGIADPKLGNANGLSFYSKTSIPLNIRVGDGAGTITYQLNRWE